MSGLLFLFYLGGQDHILGQEVTRVDVLDILEEYLPPLWMAALRRIPAVQMETVQEIRLRVGQPVGLSTPYGERLLAASGVCALLQRDVLTCSQEQLDGCFMRLCDQSVYAYEAELQQGFITIEGGIRVGVAGTAVGAPTVRTVTRITSLCIRLPRAHKGCSAPLLPYIEREGCLYSTVLVGEPSSGKTTLLRDIAATLATRGYRVTVVDERGELGGVTALGGCDVLARYPKPLGIRQAIRTLAPQAVIFDELGDPQEVEAVAECANAGVAVICSMHGDAPETVACRQTVQTLVRGGVFDGWLFLAGRRTPSVCVGAYAGEVNGDAIDWSVIHRGGRSRCGDILRSSSAPTGALLTESDSPDADNGTAHELCRSPTRDDVAWIRRG